MLSEKATWDLVTTIPNKSYFSALSDLPIRMFIMIILLWPIPSHYFTLFHSPNYAKWLPEGELEWEQDTCYSWKIMAFPIRAELGNCSAVRLMCAVLVLLAASQGFPYAEAQKQQHTQTDLYQVAHIPVCTTVFISPFSSSQFPNLFWKVLA